MCLCVHLLTAPIYSSRPRTTACYIDTSLNEGQLCRFVDAPMFFQTKSKTLKSRVVAENLGRSVSYLSRVYIYLK